MSSSATQLPYIGDEPAQVGTAVRSADRGGRSISRVAESLSLARSNINAAWTSDAKDLCDKDVGLLVDGLPKLSTGLSQGAGRGRPVPARAGGRADRRRRTSHAIRPRRCQDRPSVSTINGLVGSTRPADIATADTENAVIRAAGNTLTEVRADYQALLTKLTAVATETQTALVNSWNPTGQPTGSGPGRRVCVADSGRDGRDRPRRPAFSQMGQLADQAQADLAGINEAACRPRSETPGSSRSCRTTRITPTIRHSQRRWPMGSARAISAICSPNSVPTRHFWGAQDGNEGYQLDSDLFKMSAQVLAHATDLSQTIRQRPAVAGQPHPRRAGGDATRLGDDGVGLPAGRRAVHPDYLD